jgi:hypothetical protein
MAKIAGKRYAVRLVRGAMYVNGRPVGAVIDHDDREIRISDELSPEERLDAAMAIGNIAEATAEDDGPPVRFYVTASAS